MRSISIRLSQIKLGQSQFSLSLLYINWIDKVNCNSHRLLTECPFREVLLTCFAEDKGVALS